MQIYQLIILIKDLFTKKNFKRKYANNQQKNSYDIF